jgi:anti-anti-sigma regulatory factor
MSGSASGAVTLSLEGRITAYSVAPVWRNALETLSGNPDRPILIDASRLEYIDDTRELAAQLAGETAK